MTTSIRIEGPTENGGAYELVTWLRSLEEPVACPREEARACAIGEYLADGTMISETFCRIEPDPEELS